MANKSYPKSNLPIRRSVELLPVVFQTDANNKFLSGVVDPLVQPGILDKVVGYVGRRYGKTYNGQDIYVDTDETLRSRYQLEPGVVYKKNNSVENFYDYIDFKNQLKFFGNLDNRDDKITSQKHYTWNPPVDWDKFVNYREYYWEPSGPLSIPVLGQSAAVVSTYKVSVGPTNNSFIFTPDAFTNNPTLNLYRGQTYKFKVDAPNDTFFIKTNYDTGSLTFRPDYAYRAGELAVYDNKLWKAKVDISPLDGSTIAIDSQDWQLLEPIASDKTFNYDSGVTNNGISNGILTFTVPYNAPDILFYQSSVNPNKLGKFIISNIESNTFINVENDIIGKETYKSSNGIEFTNGLVVEFLGNVTPAKYAEETWLVEGVGRKITLTRFTDLVVPVLTTDVPEVLFDNEGFDTQPFDDASEYPTYKDYITIARDSIDANPWSRYNRWFHRSVLEYAYTSRGQDFPANENLRAKRPIIEFNSNLQLFNHGAIAKETVDYIDNYTSDVFSTVEGSSGYNIDGEFLFDGARVLITADTDSLVNNKIYQVKFITHNGKRIIHLEETGDSDSLNGECVLVQRGVQAGGLMFHFNGTQWIQSQEKVSVNQPPLFDVYDSNGVSFSDSETYPVSTFAGSKLISYKVGNGRIDSELGFSLSYLNINNVGDIQFDWNWELDQYYYTIDQELFTKDVSTGYYKLNPSDDYKNGWIEMSTEFNQPIIDSVVLSNNTNTVTFKTIDWSLVDNTVMINFYLNGKKITESYSRNLGTFTFNKVFSKNDVISLKIIADIEPDQGYYEIPTGLEKNSFNTQLTSFTLGQAIDHIASSLEFSSSIVGPIPGVSNLRDIDGYQDRAKRFLKHSGLAPLAITLLCDKTHNVIKSVQYAKKSYTDFKNNFLSKATEVDYNDNIIDFVDDIISELTKVKNTSSPFADAGMIGSGAYTAINYTVEDTGIAVFSLTEKFSLTELSRKAVYVYLNGKQLLNSKDYEFDSTFGFVRIKNSLSLNDQIEIREYVSTASSYIAPTPTSMGLYKKYTPMKYIDDTYIEPREVIQGHDGSLTFTYGDYRDDLLLELEYRIYNNIKNEYDPALFDIDSVIGGYYSNSMYSQDQLDLIVNQEFLKWIQNTNINYTLNTYFDSENSFTYTYSNMTDPTGKINLPGYWRGVYQWFYDTTRPHSHPWEMLGFSEQPIWWESEYGAAPYTSNNLLLWEDLANGIIRQGNRAGTYDRYTRSTLMSHLPVDSDGKLLSPLDAGLARDFSLINNKGSFVLGDIGPVEHAWRSSSEWPFAVTLAMCLMKPFEFIADSFDLSKIKNNNLGQKVNVNTNKFVVLDDVVVPQMNTDLTAGLIQYLVGYIKSRGLSVDTLQDKISNLDVLLSTRLSGFVDQDQQRYLLDSKNPNSASSSIFVPPENYKIIFNVSAPISSVSYSGVILEKSNNGWVITGYDDILPYFNFYSAVPNVGDPTISVGGVSADFVEWTTNRNYNNGTIVKYQNDFYRALRTHNSGTVFEKSAWQKLPDIPKIGAVEALRRRNFNTRSLKKLSYGTELNTIQQVVDFLLGYEQYLKSQGFAFNRYDPENKVSQDWLTSCKEFMFWTKHNWADGSLITLSPAALKVDVTTPIGVADNTLDGFYDYQILKSDGKPLSPQFINVNRSFQNITVETTNTVEGIYYLKLYYVLKEHVVVFDDRTVFNDIIYDKTTGYRQERIKTQGYRTVDWDGDYTSPGFLFDNVKIDAWQPFTDYRLGDIVAYKSYNWTSLTNQLGTETFIDANWSKLDTKPEKRLVSNFDYKINSFADYYEVSSDGINDNQRLLARHAIGYQPREYLQNLSESSVTQFRLYQGFIREKGTANSITKVFDKLSRSGADSITLNEEWAFRVGRFGGTEQYKEIEIQLEKNKFELNPQTIIIENSLPLNSADQYYRVTSSDFTLAPIPYTTDVTPTSYDIETPLTAGYVNVSQAEHSVRNRDELLNLNILTVNENNHIWITFDNADWTVLRLNELSNLYIIDLERTSTTSVDLILNRPHHFLIDDIIGIRDVVNLSGFYKIIDTTPNSITIEIDSESVDPEFESSSLVKIQALSNCRFLKYSDVDDEVAALFKDGSRIFIDNNGDNLWEVIEKKKQYSSKTVIDYGISTPLKAGSKVIYDNNQKQVIASIPGSGFVMTYVERPSGLLVKQIISAPSEFENRLLGSFGQKMAISPDSKFLVIGSPLATDVPSDYAEEWDPFKTYGVNEVVLYAGRLWRAKNTNRGDGSTTIAVNSDDWELTTSIPTRASFGVNTTGYYQQGAISIYEYRNNRYQLVSSFVSPRPSNNEKFGSEICISQDQSSYTMAVSATGSYNGTGRVYLFQYNGTEWTHLENPKHRGVYDVNLTYKADDIVWQASQDPVAEGSKGFLWQALTDVSANDSRITTGSSNWVKVSGVSTQSSLPKSVSVEDDGSTLEFAYTGLLSNIQIAEMLKEGDEFGTSLAMSNNGEILIVGAPYSDGQYFTNYRGVWRADVEYVENEVVKHKSISDNSYIYYRLEDVTLGADSTLRSYNQEPSSSSAWVQISDSTLDPSGKVFVYKRSVGGSYELTQMINSGSLSAFSDNNLDIIVTTGDEFGFSMDLDAAGDTLVVSSPKADINLQDQGSVYIFERDYSVDLEYRLKQKIESFENYPEEYFGYNVSISPDKSKIVVGARNTLTTNPVYFDLDLDTSFDNRRTTFYQSQGFTGSVYIFDRKDQTYFLTEKLEESLSDNESFGFSVDCVGSTIVVGSPNYRVPQFIDGVVTYGENFIGNIRLFNATNESSWTVLSTESPVVDLRLINSIELYDNVNNLKIQDLDYIDPAKGKILNIAESEIKFKTPYDPAVYTIGTDDQVIDADIAWFEKNVGMLWWNLETAKWVYYEQGDVAYKQGNWGQLATGSTIDVYEWIETPLLPSEWAAIADTNEGIAAGISGQPLYPNDNVYSIKEFFSESTGQVNRTLYYYWVRSKAVTPTNIVGRTRSAAEVSNLISNPLGSGLTFVSLIDSDKIVAYNFNSIIKTDTVLLNIQYKKNLNKLVPIHNEYQLLTDGVSDSLPIPKLENKWIDSLVGYDLKGSRIPDSNLPAKQKYGIDYRPRQSMFVDRFAILKTVVENINTILKKEPFADTIDFSNLNLVDSAPSSLLNLYDIAVDTLADRDTVGTVRIKQAILKANIVNGELDTVDIVDPGFGYRVPPTVDIIGTGQGATISLTIDNQGRLSSARVISRGKKYTQLDLNVRYFSVLVNQDSSIGNFWSVYAWDNTRQTFYRSQSQAFDTTRYWSLADWWKEGYSPTSRIVKEFLSIVEVQAASVLVGDLIRIKEFSNGGWAVFEKISNNGETFLDQYTVVGRKNGTVELKDTLWDTSAVGIGFDNAQNFDTSVYDIDNSKELRNIFKAVKENIFIGDYSVEWNKLFFTCIRYVLSEQQYVDWVFKTSFLNAIHNVGSFEQKLNYKNDNLESYQDYIDEVKPYRTTVREYVSQYNTVEPYGSAVADFDLPPAYSSESGKVVPITAASSELQQYPWKWWADNNGYSIVGIEIYNSGDQYTTAPNVLIEGNGSGAIAQAFISNGKVSGIKVLNPGSGYTTVPKISLVGGNPGGAVNAQASAILGDSKVRTFDLTMKYDRISKSGIYSSSEPTDKFRATGFSAVFDLSYAPTRDKNKIKIFKNGQIVLNSDYTISLYYASVDGYNLLRGKVIFNIAPRGPDRLTGYLGDEIVVSYEKNDEFLDAVNRINKYYKPTSGMKGNELGQLMTGMDFGGVQIQGTTFDVTGGWDALPWFTDNWDSVETSADYYVVVDLPLIDGSTAAREYSITLPFVPTDGQQITVYLKRITAAQPRNINTLGPNTAPVVELIEGSNGVTVIRIDDPNYSSAWDSSVTTNPNAQMPTIIGDGSTQIVNIGQYIELNDGDILIFRPIESDGSVTITDPNLLDTRLSGGTLSAMSGAYATATGTTAEEIVISGGNFVETDHVPAPEENVPGQVLDSVSIKVFHSSTSGAAPLESKLIISNGTTSVYTIDQTVIENKSVLVYVNKIKQEYLKDFTLNLKDRRLEFINIPAAGLPIEIISVGLGGLELLDYQEFIGDGETTLFLTSANFSDTSNIFVTLDGNYVNVGYKNSTDVINAVGKTLVEFPFKPAVNSLIKIVCLKSSIGSDLSIVQVNKQVFEFEGSTRSFELDNYNSLSRGSEKSSIVVEVNNRALQGVDTTYNVYDGVQNRFIIGTDPFESVGVVLPSNIKVFVNNSLKTFIQDYVYDGASKSVIINLDVLVEGDIVKIENDFRTEYSISGNILTINSTVDLESVNETDNDIIEVTWFSEYPSMDIISDEYTGGKVNYKLSRTPLSISYVWVYKNGERLTQDIDFYVSLPRNLVYLNSDTVPADKIKIVQFGSNIYNLPVAFEIHKDMLNFYHYKRFSKGQVQLTNTLNYYDTELYVNDARLLSQPIRSRNIPGTVYINGEKIEYLSKASVYDPTQTYPVGEFVVYNSKLWQAAGVQPDGSTISFNSDDWKYIKDLVKDSDVLFQLRRGCYGTPIAEMHTTDSAVIDNSYEETIPYNESQDRLDFVSDGSTQLVGPLDFTPEKGTRSGSWYRGINPVTNLPLIPDNYGPCDQIEIFAAGKRLRKDPLTVYNEEKGAYSPLADEQIEAEFSVDGATPYIRLSEPIPAGTRITIIKRTGRIWYNPGENTASSGLTLLDNDNSIVKFIAQGSTSLPE